MRPFYKSLGHHVSHRGDPIPSALMAAKTKTSVGSKQTQIAARRRSVNTQVSSHRGPTEYHIQEQHSSYMINKQDHPLRTSHRTPQNPNLDLLRPPLPNQPPSLPPLNQDLPRDIPPRRHPPIKPTPHSRTGDSHRTWTETGTSGLMSRMM